MANKTNIFNEAWCNMLFEDRNRQYGAYDLRMRSSRRHLVSLLITLFICGSAVSFPTIIKKVMPKRIEKMVEVTSLSNLKMEVKKDAKPKDIVVEEPEVKIKKTMKFVAPKITRDEDVKDEDLMKTQEQYTKSTTKISIRDVENGSDDDDAIDIADLNKLVVEDTISKPFLIVEQMPQFPGGVDALMKYLATNIKYPQMALESQISGRVFVRFIINSSGKVSDVEVMRGIGGGCDEEAVRVIRAMPKWIPGRQNGNAVRVIYTVPVVFLITN